MMTSLKKTRERKSFMAPNPTLPSLKGNTQTWQVGGGPLESGAIVKESPR